MAERRLRKGAARNAASFALAAAVIVVSLVLYTHRCGIALRGLAGHCGMALASITIGIVKISLNVGLETPRFLVVWNFFGLARAGVRPPWRTSRTLNFDPGEDMKISRRKFTFSALCGGLLAVLPFTGKFITVRSGWVLTSDD